MVETNQRLSAIYSELGQVAAHHSADELAAILGEGDTIAAQILFQNYTLRSAYRAQMRRADHLETELSHVSQLLQNLATSMRSWRVSDARPVDIDVDHALADALAHLTHRK